MPTYVYSGATAYTLTLMTTFTTAENVPLLFFGPDLVAYIVAQF